MTNQTATYTTEATGYARDIDNRYICKGDYQAQSAKSRKNFRPMQVSEVVDHPYCGICGNGLGRRIPSK